MDTHQILESSDNRTPMAKTVEFKIPTETQSASQSNAYEAGSTQNDCCKNGVCRVTWKPQRPAAA